MSYKNKQLEEFIQNKFPNGNYINDSSQEITNETYYLIDNNYIFGLVNILFILSFKNLLIFYFF